MVEFNDPDEMIYDEQTSVNCVVRREHVFVTLYDPYIYFMSYPRWIPSIRQTCRTFVNLRSIFCTKQWHLNDRSTTAQNESLKIKEKLGIKN